MKNPLPLDLARAVLNTLYRAENLNAFTNVALPLLISGDFKFEISVMFTANVSDGSFSPLLKFQPAPPPIHPKFKKQIQNCLFSGNSGIFQKAQAEYHPINLNHALPQHCELMLIVPSLDIFEHGYYWLQCSMFCDSVEVDARSIEILQLAFSILLRTELLAVTFPKFRSDLSVVDPELSKLTIRQVEICRYVRMQLSNHQIASQLNVSESLVKLELNRIYKLLEIRNRRELKSLHFIEPAALIKVVSQK